MSVEKYEKDEQIKFRHFVPSRWLHVRHMAITHISHENREKELKADGTISSESRSFVD